MASCPNLNEEDETEQNGYLVGSSEVGSKQVVRQRRDHKGRDELPQECWMDYGVPDKR